MRLSGAFELFGQSYQIIKRNFEVFMVLFSIGALVALWDTLGRYVDSERKRDWKDFAFNFLSGSSSDSGVFNSGGFMLIIGILAVVATLLITIGSLRAAQGHKISLGGLWRELVDGWLWLKLIVSMVLVGLFFLAGIILLIVPGIILIWRLFFVEYILIDQKTGIEEAFRRSWRMTRGFFGPIFAVILVAVIFALTTILPVFGPIIAFVLGSIYTVAPALRYQELKKLSP